MLTGSIPTFYRSRQAMLAGIIIVPLLLLGGIWWVVTGVLLTPPVPGDSSTPEDCVKFVSSERGLPHLGRDEQKAYLTWQTGRLVRDDGFREQFISALRRSAPDEKAAFRDNMILAIKPMIMADIDAFHALESSKKKGFLDERIVEYNKRGAFVAQARVSKTDLYGALPTNPAELMQLLMNNTTEEERGRGQVYVAALVERITQINADPELRADFEKQIANASP